MGFHRISRAARIIGFSFGALAAAGLARGDTWRVSEPSPSGQANDQSHRSAVTEDGTVVVFESAASNLVSSDENSATDIFVRNRVTQETTRVSVSSDGQEGNGSSFHPEISDDGRYVVFQSRATNLVPNDTNNASDIFLHDRLERTTIRVSVNVDGSQAYGGDSIDPALSGDGMVVAFTSGAINLGPQPDTNQKRDIYVRDLRSRDTFLVSQSSRGEPGNGDSDLPSISFDGRYIAFMSRSSSFSPNDINDVSDVFRHDRSTGETRRVSEVDPFEGARGTSVLPSISACGEVIAFVSDASNLVAGDTNALNDIFVKDMPTGAVERVSVTSSGDQSSGFSVNPSISGDGKKVAFSCSADDLSPDDINGLEDIYQHNRQTRSTKLVSRSTFGQPGNSRSASPALSANGLFVSYASQSTNLVPGDGNRRQDVFLSGSSLAFELGDLVFDEFRPLDFLCYWDQPGQWVVIKAIEADREPIDLILERGVFDERGRFASSIRVPRGLASRRLTLQAWAVSGEDRKQVTRSNAVTLTRER